MKKSRPIKISGFTLIELLVVTSIITILFVISIASYTQFNRSQILAQTALEIKNNLRLAQNMALTGEKPSECGTLEGYQVSFYSGSSGNPDFYTIQAKCTPEGLIGETKTFNLPSVVRFNPLPSSIFFKVLAQGVEREQTINLSGFGITKIITVSKTGEIK